MTCGLCPGRAHPCTQVVLFGAKILKIEGRGFLSLCGGSSLPPAGRNALITVKGLIEKPAPEKAPSNLAVVGRYIIEPGVFTNLAEGHKGAGGEIQLTDALASRIGKVAFAGLKFSGQRYDCGSKIGFIKANMAFALQRPELRAELQKWLTEQICS